MGLYRWFKLRFTGSDFLISTRRVYVVSKSTVGIGAALHDFQFVWQKDERDLATFCVGRFEGSNIAVNDGFARRIAGVHTLRHRVIDAVELHFQFAVAQRENAKLVVVKTIDAVRLCRGHDGFSFLSGHWV